MLIGENEKQEVLSLLHVTKEEITNLTKETWFCCACKQEVVIKNGSIKRPHFAHKMMQACDRYSEGETEEHCRGKEILASWCEQQHIAYRIEAYLPELSQRPDVLINEKMAIEFQCSSLSLDRCKERTENYLRHGYEVTWIVGKQLRLTTTKLSALQRMFLAYTKNVGVHVWHLDVTKQQLFLHYHIEQTIEPTQIYFTEKGWTLGSGHLLEILSFPQKNERMSQREYLVAPLISRQRMYQEKMLYRMDRQWLQIQECLYKKGQHLRSLPLIYFLPITQPIVCRQSMIMWRIAFWQYLNEQQAVEFQQLHMDMMKKLGASELPSYELPLIPKEISMYLFLREQISMGKRFGYLRLSQTTVKIIKEPTPYTQQEEQLLKEKSKLKNVYQISSIPHRNML